MVGFPAAGLRDFLVRLYNEQGDPSRFTWALMDHPALSPRIAGLNEFLPQLTGHPA